MDDKAYDKRYVRLLADVLRCEAEQERINLLLSKARDRTIDARTSLQMAVEELTGRGKVYTKEQSERFERLGKEARRLLGRD